MGVVKRQGIKDSIASYLGVALGAINTLFIYPKFLSTEQIGLFQWVASTALLIAPFIILGATNVSVRFFPRFRDPATGHRGFLGLLLLLPITGFSIMCFGILATLPFLTNWLDQQEPLIQQYASYTLPLILFVGISMVLASYTKNFLRIVVPGLLENAFIKVCTALAAILVFLKVLDTGGFMLALVAAYGCMLLGNLLYILFLGEFNLRVNWKFIGRQLATEMRVYGLYGILGGAGAGVMLYLDKTVIPLFIDQDGLAALGVYTIAGYIGMVVDVPKRSLEKITAPLISTAFEANDLEEIEMLYKKTSINQLIAGSLLFIGIWANVDDLFAIMPNGEIYQSGKYVILILGLSALVDMATGVNAQIISYSNYFRFNFYLIVFLAILNLVLNYFFIRSFQFHILGAALATFVSIGLYNLAKMIFIYRIWRIHPFTKNTLLIIFLAAAVLFLVGLIPVWEVPLRSIITRSFLIVVVFVPLVLTLRISPDLNSLLSQLIQKLKR